MALLDRARRIVTAPAFEWPIIAAEREDAPHLFSWYVAPLAAIGPVCAFIRTAAFSHHPIFGLITAVLAFVLALVNVIVIALVAAALAPSSGGVNDRMAALKLVAYSFTPAWLAGVLNLVPLLGLLSIFASLYGLYLIYLGATPLLADSAEQCDRLHRAHRLGRDRPEHRGRYRGRSADRDRQRHVARGAALTATRKGSVPAIPFPTRKVTRSVAARELAILEETYPQAVTALAYDSPFTLTDRRNSSRPSARTRASISRRRISSRRYPTPRALGDGGTIRRRVDRQSVRFLSYEVEEHRRRGAGASPNDYGGEVPRGARAARRAARASGARRRASLFRSPSKKRRLPWIRMFFASPIGLGLTLGKTPRNVEDDVVKLVPNEKAAARTSLAHHARPDDLQSADAAVRPVPRRGELCPSAPIVARILVSQSEVSAVESEGEGRLGER